jgi:hypothetical protein
MRVNMVDWNEKQQVRFDELRQRKVTGALTPSEQSELEAMVARLTQAADEALSPAIARLQIEQAELQERLQRQQHENQELAKLLHQQEQLVVETQRWLADFDRRHTQIREAYTRLTGDVLTPT